MFDACGMPQRAESSLFSTSDREKAFRSLVHTFAHPASPAPARASPFNNPITTLPVRPPLAIKDTNHEVRKPPHNPAPTIDDSREQLLSAQKKELFTLKRPSPAVIQDRGTILARSCTTLGQLLRDEQYQHLIMRQVREPKVVPSPSLAFHRIGNTGHWVTVTPIKTIEKLPLDQQKTIACIREKGKIDVLATAISGWRRTKTCNGRLLDSASWTQAVHDFCGLLEHELPSNGAFDHKKEGQFFACHAEKKLMLFFVCYCLIDNHTGLLNEKKLKEIRQRDPPLEAVLTIDNPPCEDCLLFRVSSTSFTNFLFPSV